MSAKINAGEGVRRGDVFFVDPFQVIVSEEMRGRCTPPTEDKIISLAESMLDYGQRQPVECRRDGLNRLVLSMGFTRTAAARLIRDGYEIDGQRRCDPEFKMKVLLTDANEETAFLHNIVENAHREATSPIDDAMNQQKLRDRYGKSDAEIARLYRCDYTKIGRLRKLLNLSAEAQNLIHRGAMTVQAGIDILDLPEDQRQTAIAAATQANGNVSGSEVRSVVRDHILSNAEIKKVTDDGEDAPRKIKPRTAREIREFFAEAAEEFGESKLGDFCKVMTLFVKGTRSTKTAREALERLAP